jgi:NAD+ diphosphatase
MNVSMSCVLPLQDVAAPASLILFQGGDLLVGAAGYLWPLDLAAKLQPRMRTAVLIDASGSIPCYALALDADDDIAWLACELRQPRQVLMASSFADFLPIGKAMQLLHWIKSHRYCGYCGAQMQGFLAERALSCSRCELRVYPRISPCVIVLIARGDEILLARHVGRGGSWFSCLAGFMEVGETPEEAIRREVREETAIEVTNIRYVSSQSWPFPSQLMLGFFADYAGGEIQVDGNEIAEAGWFLPEDLPKTPGPAISVAGQLIELFLKSRRKRST